MIAASFNVRIVLWAQLSNTATEQCSLQFCFEQKNNVLPSESSMAFLSFFWTIKEASILPFVFKAAKIFLFFNFQSLLMLRRWCCCETKVPRFFYSNHYCNLTTFHQITDQTKKPYLTILKCDTTFIITYYCHNAVHQFEIILVCESFLEKRNNNIIIFNNFFYISQSQRELHILTKILLTHKQTMIRPTYHILRI